MKKKTAQQLAMRTARHSIIVNILLAAFKLFAGIFAHSTAMVSDGVHSIADLISTVVVMIGIKLAGKKPDAKHPYGHERFECVAALLLSLLVFSVGVGIGWGGVQRILAGHYETIAVPGLLALIAAVVSIGVKEGLFWYVRATAKKIDSGALMADAWHSRADGLSSIGSFVGILGAMLGFLIMDSVAALIICLFILKTAVKIALDAIGKMTDKACDDELQQAMREVILAQPQVLGIDNLRTRLFGNKIYVDVEIRADAAATLAQAHDIAQQVHDEIEARFEKVKHCMVHVNPTQF
ncbi:MAG: cation diffusion facilitator family transporter [Oscillospiraceae bacterium]|nr:cation diffusion facilitator family transporter [Oscillospiraceae bacterium]